MSSATQAAKRAHSFATTIARHPWSSAQDFLLLSAAMIGAVVLALEYDLFVFAGELTVAERKITLGETMLLSALLLVGIVAFVLRRLREERRDLPQQIELDRQINELRRQALQDPLTGLPNRRAML